MTDEERLIEAIFGTGSNINIGDIVDLPSWYKTKNRQRRRGQVMFIHEAGGFIHIASLRKDGKPSTDHRAAIYWRLSQKSFLTKVQT